MQKTSRTGYLIRNIGAGLIGQVVGYLLVFVYRTIFIIYLEKEYLGVQGLFSDILSFLALAELGIGAAINFSLYEPVGKKDIKKIVAFLGFYKKIYYFLGIFTATAGIIVTPFLNFAFATPPNIQNIHYIFLLYVLNAAFSYFFIYKQSMLYAEQQNYIITLYSNIFAALRTIVQIIYLILFKDFIGTLIIQLIFTCINNLVLSKKVDAMHPYLKNLDSKLEKKEKKILFSKIIGMSSHHIGAFFVGATDNILIAKYISLGAIGIYSNYYLLINIVTKITYHLTSALTPGIGNLISTKDKKYIKHIFNLICFINYWIASFCSIAFITLLNPFITIWIGEEYLFDFNIVLILVINYYLRQVRQATLIYRNALGLFEKDKYSPLFMSFINITTSIYLLKLYGIIGVFLGTTISGITTIYWYEPYILFRYYFFQSPQKFWQTYIYRAFITVCIATIMHFISTYIFDGSFLSLIQLFFLCGIFPNILMALIFFRTQEFKELAKRITSLFNSLVKS